MGVRGLKQEINKDIRHIGKWIKLSTLEGKNGVILIDFDAFVHTFYFDRESMDWLFGGDTHYYVKEMLMWVHNLLHYVKKVIFVKDGMTLGEKKRSTLNQRREEKLDENNRFFSEYRIVPRSKRLSWVIGDAFRVGLIKMDRVSYIRFPGEADISCSVLANHLANEGENVLGIISNDSDFFMFPDLNCMYFPLPFIKSYYDESINGMEMGLLGINQEMVCRYFHINNASLLPVISNLCGNDFIRWEELKSFHTKLSGGPHFRKVLRYVQDHVANRGYQFGPDFMGVYETLFSGELLERMKKSHQEMYLSNHELSFFTSLKKTMEKTVIEFSGQPMSNCDCSPSSSFSESVFFRKLLPSKGGFIENPSYPSAQTLLESHLRRFVECVYFQKDIAEIQCTKSIAGVFHTIDLRLEIPSCLKTDTSPQERMCYIFGCSPEILSKKNAPLLLAVHLLKPGWKKRIKKDIMHILMYQFLKSPPQELSLDYLLSCPYVTKLDKITETIEIDPMVVHYVHQLLCTLQFVRQVNNICGKILCQESCILSLALRFSATSYVLDLQNTPQTLRAIKNNKAVKKQLRDIIQVFV